MPYSRRKFLKASAAASAAISFPTVIPRHVLGGENYIPPSNKVNIGMVGVGGKGRKNTLQLMDLPDVQVTAIADPAEYWDLSDRHYNKLAGRGPVKEMIEDHYQEKSPNYKVAEYDDFREMLDKESSLDGILCSTPDHTHAFISATAMRAGKHVYCEKPLAHNIWEVRQLKKIAKETGVATQMGNSGHSREGIRQTVELLQAGAIGEVKQAHSWAAATRWNPGMKGLPTTSSAKPKGFNWDLWIGPREMIDFHDSYTPVTWRDFWRFGCGGLGDFGCHDMDATVWAFNLAEPERIQVYPAGYCNQEIAPYGEIGYFDFNAKGKQSKLRLTWYNGSLRPPHHPALPDNFKLGARGLLFEGEKGVIQCDGAGGPPRIFPQELRRSITRPQKTIPRSNGHFRDWIDAIKGGPASSANFEYSTRLTEIVLLGVLSLRMGGSMIHWDAQNRKAKGLPEADAYIKEPIRKGWEIT